MFFSTLFILSALSLASAIPQDIPDALTFIRVEHALTDVAPFIVERTTTFAVTPSPSTSIAFPTGTGAP
ncbi:hypothetical protein C8R46DRAFT_1362353 [Mycena filopes]|nr:hypothetical protein C8R46DRAFT_1362353 [Mycena filopes]